MWQTLINWAVKYIVLPLFSRYIVKFISWLQSRKAEKDRNADIDEKLKNYENAVTPEEQENAFNELIRRRRRPSA